MKNKKNPKIGKRWISDKMEKLPMYQIAGQTPFTTGSYEDFKKYINDLQGGSAMTTTTTPIISQNTGSTINTTPTVTTRAKIEPFNSELKPIGTTYGTPAEQLATLSQKATSNIENNTEQKLKNLYNNYENPQFANIYGGVDIESRIAYGANQLGKGNTGQGVLGLASGALGLGRIGVGAYAAGNREKYIMNEYNDNVNKAMTPRTMSFEQGGMIDFMQDVGQQTQQPQPEQIIQAFAQLTQQDPQQIIQQLQQLSPEEQGQALQEMVVALQQGQQAEAPQQEMEQQFQKGGEFVKKLTGEYTTPLDENDPSVNAEVESGEYLQSPDGNITKALGESHEKNGTPVNLEGGTRIVSNHLKLGVQNAKHYKENFDLEVKASDTYAKVLDKFTKKSGLQKIVDEQEKVISQIKKSEEAAQGSSTAQSTTDLNKRFLSQKLVELEQEKAPLEEARKSLLNDVFNKQEESKPAEETETYVGEDTEGQEEYAIGGEVPKYQDGKNQDRFNDWYASLEANGYTGKRELNEARAWQAQNDPNTIISYYTTSGQPLTAKHIDMAKEQFKDAFVTAGIPINKGSSSLTPEETKRLQSAIGERLTPNFILEGHNDSKQDWRAPLSAFKGINPIEGAQPQQIVAPALPNMYQAPTEQTEPPVEAVQGQTPTGKPLNLMTLPNQSPMLPDSLEGALKVTRRYDRISPMQLSTEQQLGDLRSQEAQAINQINQLPESQRAGALANLAAITQQNIAKINADVNRTNIASENQAQQFNAQTQAQEENERASDLQDYENKIMRAKATTDADVRGYYNQLAAGNLANYNAIQNVNLLNQMYPNYGFTGQGVEQTQGAPLFSASQATANGIPVNTKKKATKKRFGGKTK